MGVPAFFRWLSGKYEKILQPVVEVKPVEVDGVKIPVDWTKPNPNGTEYDNIYLDMNGIIHPCCHPEDRPAPTTEDEMMALIFEYMDRLFSIVRPRKLIYMAVDGVAPRAKMNQQRSRRFRAAQEAAEKAAEKEALRQEMINNGLPPPAEKKGHEFDSNCITPGTEFMAHLSECLRYYIHDRLSSDPGWRNLKVILSDATVPGEGEHKIIDYIRRQRANPAHDPNTSHLLFGADADLIFLALGTHEPHFHVMREDLVPMNQKPCFLCGQMGHTKDMCTGTPKDPDAPPEYIEKTFVNIRIHVLREYLEHDLYVPGLPFPFDLERVIDDWVFICFFVGNDFLPHMPSLEIREGAIDRLVAIWKKNLPLLGGYLTSDGTVNCHRVQQLFKDLGEQEDEIFRQRKEEEERQKVRRKRRKLEMKNKKANMLKAMQASAVDAREVDDARKWSQAEGRDYHKKQMSAFEAAHGDKGDPNKAAAATLRASLSGGAGAAGAAVPAHDRGEKRKAEGEDDDEEEQDPPDDVRLWESGWKDRYYEAKFQKSSRDREFVNGVAKAYVEGLAWVLAYYFQGCASWKWYYPYHYAPFASDIANADLPEYVEFEKDTKAFNPLEQLMGVLPASSGIRFLPPTWSRLMYDESSPILDFYPTDFKLDLNGKRFAWMGVALLPFIDEKRLLDALKDAYGDLTEEQAARNTTGSDYLFIGHKHTAFNAFMVVYEMPGDKPITLNPSQTQGMSGTVGRDPFAVLPGKTFMSPLQSVGLPDIPANGNHAVSVRYWNPAYKEGTLFQPKLLKGVRMPVRVTNRDDLELGAAGGRRPNRSGFQPDRGSRPQAADRMIRHGLGMPLMATPPRGPPAPFVPGGYGAPQMPQMAQMGHMGQMGMQQMAQMGQMGIGHMPQMGHMSQMGQMQQMGQMRPMGGQMPGMAQPQYGQWSGYGMGYAAPAAPTQPAFNNFAGPPRPWNPQGQYNNSYQRR